MLIQLLPLDLFLYRAEHEIARDNHLVLLAQANGSSNRLLLDAGVPQQLNQEDVVRGRQIQSEFSSASFAGAVHKVNLAYPKAPVPVVINMILGLPLLENLSRMRCR
jgi:hypothetical protein